MSGSNDRDSRGIGKSGRSCLLAANTSWYLYNFHQGMMKSLQRAGWDVHFIAPEDRFTPRLKSQGVTHHPLQLDRRSKNPVKDFRAFLQIFNTVSSLNPYAVLNFTPKLNVYGTYAARLCGVKSFNNITGLGTIFSSNSLGNQLARQLFKVSQRFASHVLFQNVYDRRMFMDLGLVKEHNSSRIPGSGVDLLRFRPTPSPNDGVTRFLMVSRLLKLKGVREYVAAARAVRRVHEKAEFYLLGFNDMESPSAIPQDQLTQWLSDGAVRYLGGVDDVTPVMGRMDCVVLPSYYREGVPRSLLEAAAMAKPIITTDTIGCRETVQDRVSGFLCEPQCVSTLQEAMEKLHALSYFERIAMGLKGRQRVQRSYDVNRVINTYLELLEPLPFTDTAISSA